jgi:Fe-S-cluster containining protein
MVQQTAGKRTHCIRCGQCCLSSSPTLQMADISLITGGVIETRSLYTIRAGELVRDNILNELRITDREMLKVREQKNGGGCICYDEQLKTCRIYDHRPVQCKALACWDESEFMAVYDRPGAGRKDVIQDNLLLALIDEHDRRCSYGMLAQCVKQIEAEGEKPVERILEIMKFDYHFRPFISKRMGIGVDEMEFFFGRPLIDTIKMFGLEVIREPDGSFYLTVLRGPPSQ